MSSLHLQSRLEFLFALFNYDRNHYFFNYVRHQKALNSNPAEVEHMVKVSPDQSAANKSALIKAAGRLFRQRGIDGVGVAELCAAAGLTHGALYSHFGSKEALSAEAFKEGQKESLRRMTAALGHKADVADIIDFYISARHRDSLSACCPMLAAASEAARQSPEFKANFAQAFEDLARITESALMQNESNDRRKLGLVIVASMVGVVSIARALKTSDPELSDVLMDASRDIFRELATTYGR